VSKFVQHWGEEPLSKCMDAYDAMQVTVSDIEGLSEELGKFIECGYKTKPVLKAEVPTIKSLVEGGALGTALECLNVNVAVSGVNRIFTHQLVRQRIGISYSQQCSGEVDWRHADILIPRACEHWLTDIIQDSIAAKLLYAEMLDSKKVSLQEARYVLPHTLSTHIHFKCSLATLSAIYAKRCCTMSNCWEMIVFCDKIRDQLLARYPGLAPIFRESCFYKFSKPEHGIVFPWSVDKHHRDKENTDPIYPNTHEVMSCVGFAPLKEKYFQGDVEISQSSFTELEREYANNS